MGKIIIHLIRLYQRASRNILPRTCRFYPTCSSYAIEAIEKHGVFKGLVMALTRILRCSPLSKGGYDPVK